MDEENARVLWRKQLQIGLDAMDIDLDQGQQQLIDYLSLLMKWNRTFNLTAVRDFREMVARQLLDSLSVLSLLQGSRILDVGTGPGLPGIPLAIAKPEGNFTLLDSNGKKTRFVAQAKMESGLANVEVIRARVEEYRPAIRFDTVISRAFAPLPKIVALTAHLHAENGVLLAMKGAVPFQEIRDTEQTGCRVEVIPLTVPQTSGERHAILCRA